MGKKANGSNTPVISTVDSDRLSAVGPTLQCIAIKAGWGRTISVYLFVPREAIGIAIRWAQLIEVASWHLST